MMFDSFVSDFGEGTKGLLTKCLDYTKLGMITNVLDRIMVCLFVFFFNLATLLSMWDPSSLTRDQTCTLDSESTES